MKNRKCRWVPVGIALLAAGYATGGCRTHKSETELQKQLRLAHSDGIPITIAEYAALIPTAKPSENAAPLYQKMRIRPNAISSDLYSRLEFRPDQATLSQAISYLAANSSTLNIIDKAVLLPRCWFDRDLSIGLPLVITPEYSTMKYAARLVLARGALAAAQGRAADAIADVRRAMVISRQAGEGPISIGHIIRESIYTSAILELANWSFANRGETRYSKEMGTDLASYPRPNARQELSPHLLEDLETIDLCASPEGRSKLGLAPGDLQPTPLGAATFKYMSAGKTKADIVKAERARWNALKLPRVARAASMRRADKDLDNALAAYPVAYGMLMGLKLDDEMDETIRRETDNEAVRQGLVAAWRALRLRGIPDSIETKDLLSPFDGKPITYKYDGKQIVIGVSGYHRDAPYDAGRNAKPTPILLKIPNDPLPTKH